MSPKRTRKTYSRSYKLDVIQQSYQRDNVKALADELGLRAELIYRWRREYDSEPERSFPGNGNTRQSTEQEELKRLQQELADI